MRWIKAAGAILLTLPAMASPAAADAPLRIDAEAAQLARAFEPVKDGDTVLIDLRYGLDAAASMLDALGLPPGRCAFGPLQAPQRAIPASAGAAHFTLSIHVGDPRRHAANLASCEYRIGADGPETVLRLRGCYRALALSLPTARSFVLHPLPADACAGAP